ncbi:MAG: hypothetical protein OXB88_07995 [Bacteriovoracales bacterium]|nr:hypothetical protein [Bacteriovoracales bacterium]
MDNRTSLSVFIDEFGDVTAKNPTAPYGGGIFVCRTGDVEILGEKLAATIPEKIHLRKSESQDKCLEVVRQVSSFLGDLKEKKPFWGGGYIVKNPGFFKEENEKLQQACLSGDFSSVPNAYGIREYWTRERPTPEALTNHLVKVTKQWGLFSHFNWTIRLCLLAFSLEHIGYSHISIKFIFEETGNHKDFLKRANKFAPSIDSTIKDFSNLVGNHPKRKMLPSVDIRVDSSQSKDNEKISEMADVFAHIAGKVHRKNDDYTKNLYTLIGPYFNLYDSFSGDVPRIFPRGVFNFI